jgi:hypothetical protein
MKTRWLVLNTPKVRAIPEFFLKGILDAKIEPVLHFHLETDKQHKIDDLTFLFKVYAKWGVRYVTLFNKPNLRSAWNSINWTQTDLVERFLDIYLPLAEHCLVCGLIPIFPPLEPGGDYWDTIFLKASLEGIKRRGSPQLLDRLVIGAIANTNGKGINWGAGGPERWPGALAYEDQKDVEDHQGFRIFDWYQAIIRSVFVNPKSIFLFEVGSNQNNKENYKIHTQETLSIAKLLEGENNTKYESIPPEVIGAAFWILAAKKGQNDFQQAWFQPQGKRLPIVQALKDWLAGAETTEAEKEPLNKQIPHYLLLPRYEDVVSDVHLDLIRPIVKKLKPTIGFSIQEALNSQKVTVINVDGTFAEETIRQLRNAGCTVDQIKDMAQLLQS